VLTKSRLALALCAAPLLGQVAPAAALAGDLDQQQTSTSFGLVAINSTQSLAQVFTAGKTGQLDQFDLDLKKTGTPPSLTIELRNAASGQPGPQVLGSTSVAASSVATTLGFVSIPFSAYGNVVAGTQYAIVAYSGAMGGNFYQWTGGSDSTYLGGSEWTSSFSPPTTWFAGGFDTAFKTYVAPPSTATPPTGQRAAALKKCKKKKTAKARKKCRNRAKKLPV